MKITVMYYTVIFILSYYAAYFFTYVHGGKVVDRPAFVFLVNSSLLFIFLLVAYAFHGKTGGRSFWESIGFRKEGLVESLITTAATYAALNLALAVLAIALFGIDPLAKLVENAYKYHSTPWFDQVDSRLLPIAAIVQWLISGTVSFALMQAFPYELLYRRPKKYVLPSVSTLFILYYNLPLLTGEWKPDDIVFLGILCPLIYHLHRNSLGIILNYVFFYEMPVLAAFLRGWGEKAFWAFYTGRLACGLLCLIIFIIRLLKIRI